MTTNFSTIKFALSKFCCRGISHENKRFWTIFPSAPKATPPQKRKFYLLLRLSAQSSSCSSCLLQTGL